MRRSLALENALDWLLVFIPVAALLRYGFSAGPTAVFLTSSLAIIPLAGLIGRATERLAERVGEGLGGLLTATFGNAAELIIAVMALRAGLHDLVKASLTGSIIGNVLLVFGLSALLGGLRHPLQRFNRTAASLASTLLVLSAIGLVVPAIFHAIAGSGHELLEKGLGLEIAVVLFATYLLSLLFSLKTHAYLFVGRVGGRRDEASGDGIGAVGKGAGAARPLLLLVVSAALVGWMSELLVGAVEGAARSLGMSEVFVGVILVAVIGNAAEHSTAVLMALKNRMDLAVHIAIGSSIQIALLVAPLLVFLSYVIGPNPMDLRFTTFEVVAVALSVGIMAFVAQDGESNWMEGVQLLAVYLIFAIAFYFLPV
ncbi:MAG: calcium/proton exchanger [Gemmatimonadota bacterium]